MKFKKHDLLDLLAEDEIDGFKVLINRIVGRSRWTNRFRLVFAHGGKFFETSYQVGSTEQQEERPFEYEPDEIECVEVEAFERTITDYRPVTLPVTAA